MLLGRPTNLIVGAFTTIFGAVVVILSALPHPIEIPTVVTGAVIGAFGALVALIANQPPTLTPGDSYSIATPKGQPNYSATVAAPPASTTPVADPPPDPPAGG